MCWRTWLLSQPWFCVCNSWKFFLIFTTSHFSLLGLPCAFLAVSFPMFTWMTHTSSHFILMAALWGAILFPFTHGKTEAYRWSGIVGSVRTPFRVPRGLLVYLCTVWLLNARVCVCLSKGIPWSLEWARVLGKYAHPHPEAFNQSLMEFNQLTCSLGGRELRCIFYAGSQRLLVGLCSSGPQVSGLKMYLLLASSTSLSYFPY